MGYISKCREYRYISRKNLGGCMEESVKRTERTEQIKQTKNDLEQLAAALMPLKIKDKLFAENLLKLSAIQQESELLTEKYAANVIKRGIAAYITHKTFNKMRPYQPVEKSSRDNKLLELQNESNFQLDTLKKETNNAILIEKNDFNQKKKLIDTEIKIAAETSEYHKISTLSVQAMHLKTDHETKIESFNNNLSKKSKEIQENLQKSVERVKLELQQITLIHENKQNALAKRTEKLSFWTEVIEAQKRLLLEVAKKQQLCGQFFLSHINHTSELVFHKFANKNSQKEEKDEFVLKTSNEKVAWVAQQMDKEINSTDVTLLLKQVAEGDLEGVDKLLHHNPTLAHAQGDITHVEGWTFKKITAFQYAIWCLDGEMWEMMLDKKYLDEKQAAFQWDALQNERPDITNAYGKNFNFSPLFKSYRAFLDKKNTETWFKIGKEQRALPAWYIYAFWEEGADAAWVKQNFDVNIKREVSKNQIAKWTTAANTQGSVAKGTVGIGFTYIRGQREVAYLGWLKCWGLGCGCGHDLNCMMIISMGIMGKGYAHDRESSKKYVTKQHERLIKLEKVLQKALWKEEQGTQKYMGKN